MFSNKLAFVAAFACLICGSAFSQSIPMAGAGTSAPAGGGGGGCTSPQNIWGAGTPTFVYDNSGPYELGTKFTPSSNGHVTGIRFYKNTAMNGETHIVYLYNNSGTQLASITVTGETSSGWQEMDFGSPVAVTASTSYMAALSVPIDYVYTDPFSFPYSNGGCLTADASNAYYYIGTAGHYPNTLSTANNYWIDPVVTFP